MHAVATRRQGQVGAVVHQESDTALLRHRPERVGRAADRVVVDVLEAELNGSDIAGIECACELILEIGQREALRRDEIEAGQASPL
jgi:hypothetical protein